MTKVGEAIATVTDPADGIIDAYDLGFALGVEHGADADPNVAIVQRLDRIIELLDRDLPKSVHPMLYAALKAGAETTTVAEERA
jgi:hypothetical protein